MKKRILTVLSICLILLLAVSFAACRKQDLPDTKAPSKFKLDTDTLNLRWSTIIDARGYEVRISGDERIRTVKSPSYSLEYLAPGEYTIDVRALNFNPDLESSEWSSFKFTREEESGLRFNLINNRTEYEVVGSGTAFGDIVIEDVYRGKPVTKISDKAFSNNKKITSVVIGKNVKSIGKNAFAKCSELTSVTISDSVVSIGEYAFQSCKKLTSISIPNNVTAIAPSTFSWCIALTSATIGNKVESIAENAFAECAELTSITLPDSVKTIGEYAFTNCPKLASVTFGNGMESVANYAFYGCKGLTSLNLGSGVQSIGKGAFAQCEALPSLVIPDSLTAIDMEAFANCKALASITLGAGLKTIGSNAFYGTVPHQIARGNIADPALGADAEPTKADVFYLGGWLIEAVKRDSISSITVKDGTVGIADNAFQSCKTLDTARISGVKYVGNAAFAFCENLRRVYASDAILEINDYAFYECKSLVSVSNVITVTRIGNSAFENCLKLDDSGIDIPGPDVLKYLGGNAFIGTIPFEKATAAAPVVCIDSWAVGFRQGGMYMGQVDVPDVNPSNQKPIDAVGNYAFQNAVFMGGGIWLPNTVKYIGRGAFYNLYMMGGVGGAASLEYIDDYAFYGCSSAYFFANKEEKGVIQLPVGVKYIGRSAFYQCTALIGVKFPASVEYIGPYAFYGCSNLGDSGEIWGSIDDFKNGLPSLKGPVVFASGARTKYIGERAFQGCTGIKEIVLPGALEYLGARAFYKCSKLETVKFGDGNAALDIPDYTFYKCENLKTLVISGNIKNIGSYAFKDCAELESIVMGDQLETIGKYAFYGCVKVKAIVFSASVKSIGDYAFKGCAMVDSIVLPASIETIGKHAFYGLHSATFFAEPDTINPYWNERWNSSYRAILWGCELSDDKTYVVSFTKDKDLYDNLTAPNATLVPERDGYTFAGWSTDASSSEIAYTADKLTEAPDGITLYTVWTEITTDAE